MHAPEGPFRPRYRRAPWLQVACLSAFVMAAFLTFSEDVSLGAQVAAWLAAVLLFASWMWADIAPYPIAAVRAAGTPGEAGVMWKRCSHCGETLS
jgi:hypothetical protein